MESTVENILAPSDRERLLRAMTELCAEQGYAETRVAQVIERAGVSEAAFEELFSDKEDCMAQAVEAILGEVFAAASGSFSADRSEWDSGLLGIKAILELMAANPSFANLAYIDARQMGPPRAKEVYDSGVRMLTMVIDQRLRETASSGRAPRSATRAAFGGAEAVARREIMEGKTERLPQLLPDFIYLMTVPHLGQEEALALANRARQLLGEDRRA